MQDYELPEAERFRFSVCDGLGEETTFNAYAQDSVILFYRHTPSATGSQPLTIGVPSGYAEGQTIEQRCRRAIQHAIDAGLFETWPVVELPIGRNTLTWEGPLLRL
ncbi:hypothetical protein [Pandoraea sputorum]|uniref:hypothetical protein n=1 Tax=Pandoraea sputorum TaxID=93222 RepID=UPI00123FC560|nr:hypothetical protein [Pandoraea sputorum]VVE78129.1 hypothetical protein PSP31120_01509 [Pandoraea sputorum]